MNNNETIKKVTSIKIVDFEKNKLDEKIRRKDDGKKRYKKYESSFF